MQLSVCRTMKCSKEDIVGFVAALKAFVSKSDEEEVCVTSATGRNQNTFTLLISNRARPP